MVIVKFAGKNCAKFAGKTALNSPVKLDKFAGKNCVKFAGRAVLNLPLRGKGNFAVVQTPTAVTKKRKFCSCSDAVSAKPVSSVFNCTF